MFCCWRQEAAAPPTAEHGGSCIKRAVHVPMCGHVGTKVQRLLWLFLCMHQAAAGNIINMLWQLMENGLEELKLLQTVLVLLTTNTVVHDEVLSKVKGQHNHDISLLLLLYPDVKVAYLIFNYF